MSTMRTIAIIAVSLLLAGCAGNYITPTPRNNTVCQAMSPAMPIQYSGKGDTPETVKQVRLANARYSAACEI